FSIYILRLNWSRWQARWAFGACILTICFLLILFGFEYKIYNIKTGASRRVVVAALDVSASSDLKAESFYDIADDIWDSYNLDVIPFSSRVLGPENAESTALIESIKKIKNYISQNYQDEEIANLVIITDGNETEAISEMNKKIIQAGDYPQNVVYLQTELGMEKFDKSVSFIHVPRFLPKYTKEKITFSVSLTGAKLEGVPVELRLNGKNIGTTHVHLKKGYGEGSFDLILKHSGMALLEASIAIDSRETIRENNRDFSIIEGIHKGFRALHISGHPSVDTAFVRRGLQNIPGVDMISFYILRGMEQVNRTKSSELSLIPFPTDQLFQSELDNFDLIIINDFRLVTFLSSNYINNIVKFVLSGGGLLVIGGAQSFSYSDFSFNNFSKIMPVSPFMSSNWDNRSYTVVPKNISMLTSLDSLVPIKDVSFKGINRVKLNNWSNVFFSTNNGLPLITGGLIGKSRVLAVLTDSFWRFSFDSGLSNEAVLKSMVRYILGISPMPVNIFGDRISFNRKLTSLDMKNVYAIIKFINYDNSVQKTVSVRLGESYVISESDSMLINIVIKQNNKVIDNYQLLNYHEKKWNEHAFLPAGKQYLQNFARIGNGVFLAADKNDIRNSLKKLRTREPVIISDREKIKSPIYMNKLILLLFLYLVLTSFYLKSRFSD
ncbi:MAG: hypothetical protein SVR08_15300, partial [Spirochaetota bacterium]|nr:hypothetical protein [Spirochaetota bacterium]